MTFTYASLFAGVGGFETALNRLGGRCVFASEIDKHARKAYETLYGGDVLHGDITKIDAKDVPDHDLLTAGFPCQAFSVAGQRKGFEDTRGTLFFEIARIAGVKKPRALLLENVKGLVGHDKGRTLDTIVKTLNEIGYTIDFEVLNSKYFGVPQNRERIFIVAIRDDLVDPEPWKIEGNTVVPRGKRRISGYEGVKMFNFDWPAQVEVTTRLRDILETEVDEKYYLDEEKTAKLVVQISEKDGLMQTGFIDKNMQGNRVYDVKGVGATLASQTGGLGGAGVSLCIDASCVLYVGRIEKWKQKGNVMSDTGVSKTLTATDYKTPPIVKQHEAEPQMIGSLNHFSNDQMNRVYSTEGVSPTITVVSGGGREQKIAEPKEVQALTERRTEEAKRIRREYRKKHGRDFSPRRGKEVVPREDGLGNCVTATQTIEQTLLERPAYRIRKLTPRECWRLQGFADAQHDAVEDAGVSNSQRYKQAGNAVTVNVVEAIGAKLLSYLTKECEGEAVS